ncbi:MAG: hypothetical protein A2583_15050 [Bdellovibrionales bacterium RIFOXYD1_FULL_53_11]|nr:MAG: hypothetical protein A2583_15050 [Bdellovibrionales bacterium RIFOXYD1_FULL_53_11]
MRDEEVTNKTVFQEWKKELLQKWNGSNELWSRVDSSFGKLQHPRRARFTKLALAFSIPAIIIAIASWQNLRSNKLHTIAATNDEYAVSELVGDDPVIDNLFALYESL